MILDYFSSLWKNLNHHQQNLCNCRSIISVRCFQLKQNQIKQHKMDWKKYPRKTRKKYRKPARFLTVRFYCFNLNDIQQYSNIFTIDIFKNLIFRETCHENIFQRLLIAYYIFYHKKYFTFDSKHINLYMMVIWVNLIMWEQFFIMKAI